jgi:hypothetical protein
MLKQLLSSKDVAKNSSGIAAGFPQIIILTLQKAILFGKEQPQS